MGGLRAVADAVQHPALHQRIDVANFNVLPLTNNPARAVEVETGEVLQPFIGARAVGAGGGCGGGTRDGDESGTLGMSTYSGTKLFP